ncbi:arsenical pump-driving ATPase [Paenibacillus phoenicis]|uniref:Arsenical pump-driving ATPase n=2 Tax=Paenibacillus TaxID=44249 RepID=A0ABW3S7L6_9BACL|nr:MULTISPECIES: arsenical pump-driving ATPase [Paenibacillus]MCH1638816.1 arsenical pump-driving ATPase [Paenibacillus timonensis]MDU2239914.1 arsenical pump-driving ATPase [Paenibacillus sp.]MEA3570671.1 arsenical pump-driving ATPase [Paenibacillus phoenicis]
MPTRFDPLSIPLTPYLFFTGKGGVGKTSTACATAISLADSGKRVLLVGTDPASNLQDVFGMAFTNHPVQVDGVDNLYAANLDPETAAAEYKASMVDPYRGKLPDTVIATMEEQLSGACTVEIAAFNEFSALLTDQELKDRFDYILFDTAPTGHTLRLLQLPTAWSGFLNESTHGASCLGPLAGLQNQKKVYEQAVQTLTDEKQTMLVIVTRPDESPLTEAARASVELKGIGIHHQNLVINGVLNQYKPGDPVSKGVYERQLKAMERIPPVIQALPTYQIPMAPFNVTGLQNLRDFFEPNVSETVPGVHQKISIPSFQKLIQDLDSAGTRVVFTMGKGGVGKTTVASAIAVGLAERGHRVHLSTTDPAAHLDFVIQESEYITVSRIDPKVEVQKYQEEIIDQNKDLLDEDGLAYLEEDLRSPCTEEIAVFRAFAELVDRSGEEIVVIDTAPTGHTLLLLDATQEYHKEIERSSGQIPPSVQKLLPRLRDSKETSVVIVTLAEATPYYEAVRLNDDLKRAGIPTKWWVINQSFAAVGTTDPVLQSRARSEQSWIQEINETSNHHTVIIPWEPEEIKGYTQLKKLIAEPT